MSKRSTRFYRRNEERVMKELGFKPTINSGAGWISKEDGENDIALCQLKSTDAQSISIKKVDLYALENHAAMSHKVPVFAIQFLDTGEVWCMIKPENLKEYMESIKENHVKTNEKSFDFFEKSVDTKEKKSYNNNRNTEETKKAKLAREQYYKMREAEKEEKEKKYKKGLREWRRTLNKKG